MNSDRVTAIMTMNNNTFNYSNRFNLIMEKNDCNTVNPQIANLLLFELKHCTITRNPFRNEVNHMYFS